MADVVRSVTIRGSSPGVAEATAALAKLSGAHVAVSQTAGVMAVQTDRAGKAILSQTGAVERLAKSLDEGYRAETKLAAGVDTLTKAEAAGQSGTRAYEVALAGLQRQVAGFSASNDNSVRSLHGLAGAHHAAGGAAYSNRLQMLELGHVAKSVFDELAAGQSPFRALAIEGGRLTQAIGTGEGGLTGMAGRLLSTVGGFLNPFTVGIAAVGGLAAAAVLARNHLADMREEMNKAVSGVGAFAGLSGSGLDALARQRADAVGLPIGDARTVAAGLASTGRLDAGNIGGVLGLTRGYAGAYGTSNTDAGKALAGIFSDPLKGLDTLNERFGFLTASTRSYVDTLVREGREQEAVKVAIDAASMSLNQFSAPQGPIDRLSSWFSRRNDEVGHALDRDLGMLPVDPRQAYIDASRSNGMGMMNVMNRATMEANSFAEDLRNRSILSGNSPLMTSPSADLIANRRSLDALTIGNREAPEAGALRNLQADRDKLRDALGDPDVLKRLGDQAGVAFAALDKMNIGLSTFSTAAERMRQDSAFRVAAINADDAAGKLAIDTQAAYANTLRDSHDAAQAAAAAETTRAEAVANATQRITDATDALDRQTKLIGLKPYQRLAVEAQNRLDDMTRDNAIGAGRAFTPSTIGGTAALDRAPANILPMITDASSRTGLPAGVIAAIGEKENSFRLTGGTTMLGADGRPSSAFGYGQLTNGAAADVAREVPGFNKYDPSTAVFGSAEYLKILMQRNGGDMTAALNAYGGTSTYAADIMRRTGGSGMPVAGAPSPGTDTSSFATSNSTNLAKNQAQLGSAPFETAREGLDRLTGSVQAQMDAYGKTGRELDAYNEKTKILNQLQDAGVPITDAMRSRATALGQAYADASKPLDDFMKRQKEIVGAMDDVRGSAKDFLNPLIQAGLHGTSVMAALHSGLESIASRLTGRLESSILDTFLGPQGSNNPGLLGGAIGLAPGGTCGRTFLFVKTGL